MPTYEYVCEKCNHSFEVFQSMTEPPLKTCPKEHCSQKRWGKGPVKRLIGSGAGFIFKGSGFYITDYRSDSYKSSVKKESESKTGSSSSSSSTSSGNTTGSSNGAKSETKPAPAVAAASK